MKSFAVAAALVGAAIAAPQAATTSYMSPSAPAPSGCSTTYPGSFQISVTNVTFSKRDLEENLEKRAALTATLNNGVLRDNQNRIGEIVANRQFQFDVIVQSGAIYTAGWSVCSNGTLALGNSAVFYQCLSGNFYNLYDRSQGAQCSPIFINVIGAGSASTTSVAASATQVTDGQVQASTRASTAAVSQITDGQVQASTGRPVTQITDGQIQASTRASTSSARPVTQISDGQIQASTRAATTSSARPVSQISDGQIQATTGRPVTQISDGQIQATTARSSGAVVTQISDGQIQATTGRNASTPTASRAPTVSAFTGAAAQATAGVFAMVAGGLAMALL